MEHNVARWVLTDARIRRRIVAHKDGIRCRAAKGVVLGQPAIVAGWWLVSRWRSLIPSSSRLVWWRIIPNQSTAMVIVHGCLSRAQQSLAISAI